MQQDAHDDLDATYDSYELRQRLRAVPPHEVWAVRVDGQRAVYKRNTGSTGRAATEGAVTAFVGDRTSVPVPTVCHVGADHYVAAWHPDAPAPEAERTATESWARPAGEALATLHRDTAPAVEGYGTPRSTGDGLRAPHDDWHAAAVDYLRDRRRTLADYGHADLADAVLDRLRDRPDAFDGAGPAVCCHGWWTPEHLAVRDGEPRCVVDFEHALAAPAEFDYWRAVLPTFFAEGDEVALAAFREGYESVRGLPAGVDDRKPWFLLLCETYYVESLYVQSQHGQRETERRAGWLRERVFDRLEGL